VRRGGGAKIAILVYKKSKRNISHIPHPTSSTGEEFKLKSNRKRKTKKNQKKNQIIQLAEQKDDDLTVRKN